MTMRTCDLESLVHQLIAHRGVFDNIQTAENSQEAFAKAMSLDYPIELDVHITTDEQLVVFHDDSLKRMTGDSRRIADCTLAELKELRLKHTDCVIPTLKETLSLVENHVPLLIELKYDTPIGKMEAPLLQTLLDYQKDCDGRFAVQSFDPFRMKWFYDHAPEIPRGQLVSDFTSDHMFCLQKLALRRMWLNVLSHPDFISASLSIIREPSVTHQRKKGRFLFGWTARSQAQLDDAAQVCDSVIFDGFLPRKKAY